LQLCVALAEVLGITTTGATDTGWADSGWLLVAEHEQQRWALAVDQVAGVQQAAREQMTAVPATVVQGKHSYSQGVFFDGDRRVGLLDAERLFGTLQRTSW
jgi:chemotaxis signal transduction protein